MVRLCWTDDFIGVINPELLSRLLQVCTGERSYRCAHEKVLIGLKRRRLLQVCAHAWEGFYRCAHEKGMSCPRPRPPSLASPVFTEGRYQRQLWSARSPLPAWGQHSCTSSPLSHSGSHWVHLPPMPPPSPSWLLLFPWAPKESSSSFNFDLEFLKLLYTIPG